MIPNFITVAFLYFFFHHPDSLVCLSEERGQQCTQDYNPVCSLYTGDDCESPTGYCVKTSPNSCTACADPSIVGIVINGECPYLPVQVCSQEHSLNSCANMEVQGTVCGITEDSSSSTPDLSKTLWDNGCQACNAGDSTFYLGGDAFGQCLAISTSTICSVTEIIPEDCENSALKACGYYTGGDCTEQVCRRTYDHYCAACSDETVMFFQNGDCSEVVPIGEEGTDPVFDEETEEIAEEEMEEEYVPVKNCRNKSRRLAAKNDREL